MDGGGCGGVDVFVLLLPGGLGGAFGEGMKIIVLLVTSESCVSVDCFVGIP